MERRLEMIHLQLTRQCNLNCWFCGQRKNSALRDGKESMALKTEEWLGIVNELDAAAGKKPSVMLWGGEPLMSPCFDEIASTLHERGYRVGIVTNGTLLDRHAETVPYCLDKIYVSVDGPEQLHDSIRGAGTFRKIRENLLAVKRAAPLLPVVCMAVLTEELKGQLKEFFAELSDFPVDEVLLQDMIVLNGREIGEYKAVMEREFSIEAEAVESWRQSGEGDSEMEKAGFRLEEPGTHAFKVRYLPHVRSGEIVRPCLSPWRHLHIMWNGETSFCTDFTDFSMGNVREQPLEALFRGEQAEKFRKLVENGRNPACRHCSWGDKEDFFEL